MLLLPVSHEDAVVRRVPWVSLGILGVCVAIQIYSDVRLSGLEEKYVGIEREMHRMHEGAVGRAREAARERAAKEELRQREVARRYRRQRPDRRGVDAPEQQDNPFVVRGAPGGAAGGEPQGSPQRVFDPDDPWGDDQQARARYAELQAQLDHIKTEVPSVKFGYRPALDGVLSLFSYMFAHGGWLHLLGNMWFLYMVACNLEDRWGRWQFLSFYVVAGLAAGLSFDALHPGDEVALVGASGAVAGAMGAFMVCFAGTKVKMFYLYFIFIMPRWGTFRAPAWAVLLLWLLQQAAMTLVESFMNVGVAYSAHLGGFVFGTAVALLLRRMHIEEGLDEAAQLATDRAQGEWQEDSRYLQAMSKRDMGEAAAAVAILVELTAESPDHRSGQEALFELGLSGPDLNALDVSVPRLVAIYQHQKDGAALAALYRRLRAAAPNYGLTDKELSRIAAAGEQQKDPHLVIAAVTELLQQYPSSRLLPRALWLAAQAQEGRATPTTFRKTLERIVRDAPEHACARLAEQRLAGLPQGATS